MNQKQIQTRVFGSTQHKVTQITAAALIRYALSFGIDVAIVGCSTPAEVKYLADAGHITGPMAEKEKRHILSAFKSVAQRLAYYRGTI